MELIVRLDGGLGNQLFQYAAGYALARRTMATLTLDLTPLLYTRHLARDYMLDRFTTDVGAVVKSPPELALIKLSGSRQKALRWPAQVARALLGVHDVFEPAAYRYAPPQLPPKRKVRITGWWQSFQYAMAFEPDIRRQFQLRSPSDAFDALLRQIQGAGRTVSVHVRRGDYLTDRPGAVLPPAYFNAAADQLSPFAEPSTFFIFSDDLDWAMEKLQLPGIMAPVELNGGRTPEEELHLMAACQDHIIANSTFSWWGAWLNPRPGKQVVAPRQWLAEPDSYFPDLLPPDWSTVPVPVRDDRSSAALK